jgi:hypothetical protein
MELFGSDPFHLCRNDVDSIGFDMVGTLKELFSMMLYYLMMGIVLILFVFALLGLMLIDFVMDTFTKITRSFKKHD